MAKRKKKGGFSPAWIILTLLVLTAGFWSVVQGFSMQLGGAQPLEVVQFYFGGFLLIGIAKWMKYEKMK